MTLLEHAQEIRRAIRMAQLLHASGRLDRADMDAAARCIEDSLLSLEAGIITASEIANAETVSLPVMTLADVAREHRNRRPPARLVLVQGGAA